MRRSALNAVLCSEFGRTHAKALSDKRARGILGQPAVAHLGESPQLPDHAKDVLDSRTHRNRPRNRGNFNLALEGHELLVLVARLASRSHISLQHLSNLPSLHLLLSWYRALSPTHCKTLFPKRFHQNANERESFPWNCELIQFSDRQRLFP